MQKRNQNPEQSVDFFVHEIYTKRQIKEGCLDFIGTFYGFPTYGRGNDRFAFEPLPHTEQEEPSFKLCLKYKS